jgi:hypothetical protein
MTDSNSLSIGLYRALCRRTPTIFVVIFSLNWVSFAHADPHGDCLRALRARLATGSEVSLAEFACLSPNLLSGTHSTDPFEIWRIHEPADSPPKPAMPPIVQIHDEEQDSSLSYLSTVSGPNPEYIAATAWLIQQVTIYTPEFELLNYLALEFVGDSFTSGACAVIDIQSDVLHTIDLADASPGGLPSTCPNVQQLCIPGRAYLSAALIPDSEEGRFSVFSDLTVFYANADVADSSTPFFSGGYQ